MFGRRYDLMNRNNSGAKSIGTGKKMMWVKAHSPELLLAGGIGLMVGGIVTTIIAARKQDDIWDEHNAKIEEAKLDSVIAESGEEVTRTEAEKKKAVRKVWTGTVVKEVKTWGPPAAFYGGSVACFIGMHNVQAGRIAGLSATATGLREMFDRYQKNNIEQNGLEAHNKCLYGTKTVKEVDPETGEVKIKEVVKEPEDLRADPVSEDYFLILNPDNSCLTGYAATDALLLDGVEEAIKRGVRDKKVVVWNDAYDMLGAERTTPGMVNGWIEGGVEPGIGWRDNPMNAWILRGENPGEKAEVYLCFNSDGNVFNTMNAEDKRALERKATFN